MNSLKCRDVIRSRQPAKISSNLAVVTGNFLIGKNVKCRKIMYAINANFKLFSLKDMMYLSRWNCIYRPSTSWNCLKIVTLVSIVFFYETTQWLPKNILNISIHSSFNWSTLTFGTDIHYGGAWKTSKARFAVWLQIH